MSVRPASLGVVFQLVVFLCPSKVGEKLVFLVFSLHDHVLEQFWHHHNIYLVQAKPLNLYILVCLVTNIKYTIL